MKPKTQISEVNSPVANRGSETAHPVVHGRVRFGRFLVGGAALVGMIAVSMFNGTADLARTPLVGAPETTVNASPGDVLNNPAGPGGAPAPSQPSRLGGGNHNITGCTNRHNIKIYLTSHKAFGRHSYHAVVNRNIGAKRLKAL